MTDWSANQYTKFIKERTQPAIDLANKITISKDGVTAEVAQNEDRAQ